MCATLLKVGLCLTTAAASSLTANESPRKWLACASDSALYSVRPSPTLLQLFLLVMLMAKSSPGQYMKATAKSHSCADSQLFSVTSCSCTRCHVAEAACSVCACACACVFTRTCVHASVCVHMHVLVGVVCVDEESRQWLGFAILQSS